MPQALENDAKRDRLFTEFLVILRPFVIVCRAVANHEGIRKRALGNKAKRLGLLAWLRPCLPVYSKQDRILALLAAGAEAS